MTPGSRSWLHGPRHYRTPRGRRASFEETELVTLLILAGSESEAAGGP